MCDDLARATEAQDGKKCHNWALHYSILFWSLNALIGTGRLIALVGVEDFTTAGDGKWQVLFGLVLSIAPKTTKNKHELPAARIHRQCNPKYLEVAFLSD